MPVGIDVPVGRRLAIHPCKQPAQYIPGVGLLTTVATVTDQFGLQFPAAFFRGTLDDPERAFDDGAMNVESRPVLKVLVRDRVDIEHRILEHFFDEFFRVGVIHRRSGQVKIFTGQMLFDAPPADASANRVTEFHLLPRSEQARLGLELCAKHLLVGRLVTAVAVQRRICEVKNNRVALVQFGNKFKLGR